MGRWEDEKRIITPQSTVNTQHSPLLIPQIQIYTQMTNSNTVKITIADNGPGIQDSLRSRLFDPFFTTKPVGKGSGLGLSISYQVIVQKHRGNITCNSSVGQGAEFTIEIPIEQPES